MEAKRYDFFDNYLKSETLSVIELSKKSYQGCELVVYI